MSNEAEIEEKFWKALRSDMTMMLGLVGVEEGHSQPMTAQIDKDAGPIWFFTSKDVDLVKAMGRAHRATATFTSKGHDIFASLEGTLVLDNDRATIDRLWNRFIAAWFEGGKDDPKLTLLRFETSHAQLWLNENSLFAGFKMLMGSDPKQDYKDKVAEVNLRQ